MWSKNKYMNYAELLQNAENQHKAELAIKKSEKAIKAELLLGFAKEIYEFMLFIHNSDYCYLGNKNMKFFQFYSDTNNLKVDIENKLNHTIYVNIKGCGYVHFFLHPESMKPTVELSSTCFFSVNNITDNRKERIHTFSVASEFMEFLAKRVVESKVF